MHGQAKTLPTDYRLGGGFGLTNALGGGEIILGGRKKQVPVSYGWVPFNGKYL